MGMANLNESSYVPDPSSLFSIAPRQGTLDRDEEKTFEILFAPNKVRFSFQKTYIWFVYIDLIVSIRWDLLRPCLIWRCKAYPRSIVSSCSTPRTRSHAATISCERTMPRPSLSVSVSFTLIFVVLVLFLSPIFKLTVISLAMAIEMRGECVPYQFALDPPAIFIQGEIYMQTSARKSFRV